MKKYAVLCLLLCSSSCAKDSEIINAPRSQEVIVSGFIAYRNFEYEFYPRTRLYADGELVENCISIIPSDALRGLFNDNIIKSKDVTVKAVVYRYPEDFLPRDDETIVTHHLTLSCGGTSVLLIRKILK